MIKTIIKYLENRRLLKEEKIRQDKINAERQKMHCIAYSKSEIFTQRLLDKNKEKTWTGTYVSVFFYENDLQQRTYNATGPSEFMERYWVGSEIHSLCEKWKVTGLWFNDMKDVVAEKLSN